MRVLALANLYRDGHVARLSAYRPANPAASSWNTALFDALAGQGVDLHVAQFLPIRRAASFGDGGLTYHYLPRLPWVDGFTSSIKRARTAALVRRLKPEVIHGIGSEHGYAWAAVGHGVPSLVTIHGYLRVINSLPGHASRLKRWFLVPEEGRALRGADRVVAINEYMRDRFVAESGVDRQRTVVIPNALNPVFLQSVPPVERDIDLLLVGTLHPLKNQHLALEFLARLQGEHGLRPRVAIVGAATVDSAAYGQGLEQTVRQAGMGHVRFLGKKSPAELAELYRRSRFLLHLSSFEADPTVVAEALACGAVPVVNPVAGLAYRVRDGENGIHLPVAQAQSAPRRLAACLADESSRLRLAHAGRDEVIRQRQASAVATATVRAWAELAGGPVVQGLKG